MNRKMTIICLVVCLMLIVTGCGGNTKPEEDTVTSTPATESASQTETVDHTGALDNTDFDAVAFAESLFTGTAQELEANFNYTEVFINALAGQGGFEGLQTSLAVLGELKSVGEPIVTQGDGFVNYSVPCELEVQNINILISIDADLKIQGVFTEEYTGNAGEEDVLPLGLSEIDLNLPIAGEQDLELPGTLTLPAGDGPFPVVILVHGSGANDRDETLGANKPFRDLAWDLAGQGIAVYRYDKRTLVYGQQMAQDMELTINEETVDDAVAAVQLLTGQEMLDRDRIYVLGHSLGGLALPRIDRELNDNEITAAGYIFLAAPARKLNVIMREQYAFLFSLIDNPTEEEKNQLEQVNAELDQLDSVGTIDRGTVIFGAYPAYWQDLENYSQTEVAADIEEPCLVLQGEEDYQVTMEDFEIWKDACGDKPNWTFISYPGLTHLFMSGSKANGPADYQMKQNVDERVVNDIAAFINEYFIDQEIS